MTRCPAPGCGARTPCAAHRPFDLKHCGPFMAHVEVAADRARAAKSRARGAAVELVIAQRLRALGVLQVAPIQVGFRRKSTIPMPRVLGDFRGILPGGRSVLVEVKYRPARLAFGDLEPHQVVALEYHAHHGGLSLLGWRWDGGDAVMQWPVPGFSAGKGLGPEQARAASWAGVA